ncbi:MAG: diguanylate cyclase [Lysobacterales bacterium]
MAIADEAPRSEGQSLQKVRVQLKWTHQFQFAGFYAAIEQGFFKDVGLAVELIEGGPQIDPTNVVLAGDAEFGIGNSSLLIDYSKGRPVMAVAAILQHSPFVILARLDPTLRSIRDLEGRSLMGEAKSDELTAYLRTAGVDTRRVRMIPHSGTVSSLIAEGPDRADAMTAYISTEPFEAARRNIPYQIFNPRDLNINFHGDTLFTSQRRARQHPNTVIDMRNALIKGWRYALTHQAEIVELILTKYRQKMDRAELNLEAQATYNLFQTDLVEIGYMNRERWQSIGEIYAASGMMPEHFSLDGFLFPSERTLPSWAYQALLWGALAIMLGGLLAVHIYSLNRRLSASLKQLAIQTENLRSTNEQLARLSITDPLTGLYNRRHFDQTLANEFNRALRNQSALCMLMIDIDLFKTYNDTLGHPAGDACLQRVAEVLSRNAQRGSEFAARVGGEEFAVVASNLSTADVSALAERIRQEIADLRLPHPGSPLGYVTVSIGVSIFERVSEPGHEQLINQADAALYQAKEAGRNRCVAFILAND